MKNLMVFFLGCVIFLQSLLTCNCTQGLIRHKRGVLDLVVTLWCYRNKLKVPLLGINLYGCHCGTGGTGYQVDAVDRCCFLHDCCYYHSRVVLKCHSKVKWEFYNFSCSRDHTRCTSPSVCGRMACECDRQFAECLTRVRPKNKHFFYNRKDLCSGSKDACPQIFPSVTEIFQWSQNISYKETNAGQLRKKKSTINKLRNRNKISQDTQNRRAGDKG
ncbi:phospholipase A2-like [Pelodytes ibericus]